MFSHRGMVAGLTQRAGLILHRSRMCNWAFTTPPIFVPAGTEPEYKSMKVLCMVAAVDDDTESPIAAKVHTFLDSHVPAGIIRSSTA